MAGAIQRSLLVPSVKELLEREALNTVPERYIHHDLEPAFAPETDELPVVSLSSLLEHDDPAEHAKLHTACRHWGFFQLVDHGVSAELIERFKVECKEFFELPMEEKKKYWQTPQEVEGFGQKFVVSDDQKLEWADSFNLTLLPLQLRKPHLLPKLPLPFRETLESYTSELKQLATKIFDCMAKDLNIDKELLKGLFDDGKQSKRIMYYPPCPESDKVIGLRPHSDASAITILLQLNQVEGLQIRKDGKWSPVVPLPGAFIVNIGDVMEIVSNGIYRSVEHRVMVDPKIERLSAATFFNGKFDTEVGPAPSLVTSDSPARFSRITIGEYYKRFYGKQLTGKTCLDTVRIYPKKGF